MDKSYSKLYSPGRQTMSEQSESNGFTIVELLVVIVVIGILAAITLVSYTGVTSRANIAVMQSDLSNSSNQLKNYQTIYGSYPTALDASKCPSAPTADTTLCLKTSPNNTYTYYPSTNGTTFNLVETNTNGMIYNVTDSTAVAGWLAIGTQVWAKANLNVGTRIAGTTDQANNGVTNVEKYCYNNTESNCTTYGGLYQWDEAMQYVITAGAQGICSTGSHIPTDAEWTTLETYLGSATAGTQLQFGGSSGLNIPLAGWRRYPGGSFGDLSLYAYLWSSSESSTSAWIRFLNSGSASVGRGTYDKGSGFSVRCLGNWI